MADILDLAAEREELARAAAITHRRPVGPQPNGRCHHCDEIVADEQRWCDADCRDAYDRDHPSSKTR